MIGVSVLVKLVVVHDIVLDVAAAAAAFVVVRVILMECWLGIMEDVEAGLKAAEVVQAASRMTQMEWAF